jgi:hypothetical protein
LLVGVLLWQR